MTTTIGSQTDVPAPGDPIVSPWYQDTSTKLVHRFASLAAANTWTTAPDGAVCVTTDTQTTWHRIGGVWRSPGWVRAWRTAALSCGGTAYTKIVFDNKTTDVESLYNTTTGEYTVPVTGVYQYQAAITIAYNNTPQTMALAAFLNGAVETRGTFLSPRGGNTGDQWGLTVAGSSQFTAGAKLTFQIYNGGTNAISVDVGGASITTMSVFRITP